MRLSQDLIIALLLDAAGSLLLLVGVLGYVGLLESVSPIMSQPEGYLTCGALGIVFTALATPRLLRAVRARRGG
jgi:hypothetical protein